MALPVILVAISVILALGLCLALVGWERKPSKKRGGRGKPSLFSAFFKPGVRAAFKRPGSSSMALQDLSKHSSPSSPSSPSSSSAHTAAAAASLASGLPVVGGLFSVIAEVAGACAQAIDNVDNCNSVARRMRSLQQPLRSCERHFRAQGSISQGQLDALANLCGLLEQIKVQRNSQPNLAAFLHIHTICLFLTLHWLVVWSCVIDRSMGAHCIAGFGECLL